jgi:hypothetical protein
MKIGNWEDKKLGRWEKGREMSNDKSLETKRKGDKGTW